MEIGYSIRIVHLKELSEKNCNEKSSCEDIQHPPTELIPTSQDKSFVDPKVDLSANTSMPEILETNEQDLADQLAELLNKASGMIDKLQMYKEWFYFIDSGGQI